MTTTGTSYFKDFTAACKYYRAYRLTSGDVQDKIYCGEIHIGKPEIKPGETLSLIDNGTRYAITSKGD